MPRTLTFAVRAEDPADPYARVQTPAVIGAIAGLRLPRYGLGNYLAAAPVTPDEDRPADCSLSQRRS